MATMQTHYLVRNINGTSAERFSNSSSKDGNTWLEIWRREAQSDRTTCCVLDCSNTDLVGGHVMIVDKRSSNEWWLAPICHYHNHHTNTQPMFIDKRVQLISVRDDDN